LIPAAPLSIDYPSFETVLQVEHKREIFAFFHQNEMAEGHRGRSVGFSPNSSILAHLTIMKMQKLGKEKEFLVFSSILIGFSHFLMHSALRTPTDSSNSDIKED
jgi:hypothetical protein